MKIVELERRINDKIIEQKLNNPENADTIRCMIDKVEYIINKEIRLIIEEMPDLHFDWLHRGNPYCGKKVHNLYTSLIIMVDHKSEYSSRINFEFEIIKKQEKSYKDMLWYIEKVNIKINKYSNDDEIEDIVKAEVDEIKEHIKLCKQQQAELKRKEKEEELANKRFVEEKTRKILEYIKINNLDLQEFKNMASDYILYSQHEKELS